MQTEGSLYFQANKNERLLEFNVQTPAITVIPAVQHLRLDIKEITHVNVLNIAG